MILSIVVPIYGVEKYIDNFLISLTKNLVDNVEAILVDDGSKDNCGSIIDNYALEHKENIKVIHKKNGGLSSARNAGLLNASGEYIIFPDPDDILENNYSKSIIDAIIKYNHPDMIFFDYNIGIEDNFKKITIPKFKEGRIDRHIFVKEYFKYKDIVASVGTKAIKKSIIGEKKFREDLKYAEDDYMVSKLLKDIQNIIYIKKATYNYIMRAGSLSKTLQTKDLLKAFDIALEQYNLYKSEGIGIEFIARRAFQVLKNNYMYSESIEYKCEKFIKTNIKKLLTSLELTMNEKKQFLFVTLGIAKYYYRK